MPVSEKQAGYRDKYDKAHFAYRSVKVKKELLADFLAACAERGERPNTVMRQAMERYVADFEEEKKKADEE